MTSIDTSQSNFESIDPAALGEALQRRASDIAERWRRLQCRKVLARHRVGKSAFGVPSETRERAVDDARPPPRTWTALLDGVAEPLVFEVGRQLAMHSPSDAAPWVRCRGLLRLSVARGREALDEEFDLLAAVVDGFARTQHASTALRESVRRMLGVARSLACAELWARTDASNAPPVRFGGVVLELYEPWLARA